VLPDTVDRLGTWTVVLARPITGKYEGMSFPDPQHGWVIAEEGVILHTADGGSNWVEQASGLGHLRSLDFLDNQRGCAGTLAGIMWHTEDGGLTWNDITHRFPIVPIGFCGIAHSGDVVHVVGRYANAADYFRSTDAGTTWTRQSLGDRAQGLVDVVFTSPSVGFIGGRALNALGAGGSALILKTTDGGDTWRTVFVGDYGPGWAWKIQPVTASVVHVALASMDGTLRFGRSLDAGETGDVEIVATGHTPQARSGVQGVGFLDNEVGWLGGFYGGLYATTDAGQTWHHVVASGSNINRFRKVGNTLFTASTEGILRYDPR